MRPQLLLLSKHMIKPFEQKEFQPIYLFKANNRNTIKM